MGSINVHLTEFNSIKFNWIEIAALFTPQLALPIDNIWIGQ